MTTPFSINARAERVHVRACVCTLARCTDAAAAARAERASAYNIVKKFRNKTITFRAENHKIDRKS